MTLNRIRTDLKDIYIDYFVDEKNTMADYVYIVDISQSDQIMIDKKHLNNFIEKLQQVQKELTGKI